MELFPVVTWEFIGFFIFMAKSQNLIQELLFFVRLLAFASIKRGNASVAVFIMIDQSFEQKSKFFHIIFVDILIKCELVTLLSSPRIWSTNSLSFSFLHQFVLQAIFNVGISYDAWILKFIHLSLKISKIWIFHACFLSLIGSR